MVRLSGIDALTSLSGNSSEVAPIRILFLVHRVGASGRLWLTRGADIRSINFVEGKISGCAGFTSLLDGMSGDRTWSINDWAQGPIEQGSEPDQALNAVGEALCLVCMDSEKEGDWTLNFVPAESQDPAPELIPEPLGLLVQGAIRSRTSDDDVRTWFEGGATTGLCAHRPVDSPVERWSLDEKSVRLLEVVESEPSVGRLFVEIGADGWSSLGVLWKLGLIEVLENTPVEDSVIDEPVAVIEPDPPQKEERPEPAPKPSTGDSQISASDVPPESKPERARKRPPSDRPAKAADSKRGSRPKKKRRLDPRRVAIRRNPWESPQEQIESHLKEAYDVLQSVRPEFIFRLKKSPDLEKANIDKRHREACARYHPDRYRTLNQGAQALAEGCFTAVSDAYHRLMEADYMESLRVRLIERETGKKVVTEKTRIRAKVDFAKSDALFKQKRFGEAYQLALSATEGDPDRWQHHFMRFRAGYRSGELGVAEVEEGILRLQGMTTVEKADQLYTLGEILLREGDEVKAYKLFKQAVSLDDQNVGANRRLRLRDRRERSDKEKPQGGLFGGLFQRRKG